MLSGSKVSHTASMNITDDIWRIHRYEQSFSIIFQLNSILRWANRLHGAVYQNSNTLQSYLKLLYMLYTSFGCILISYRPQDDSESMFYGMA
jgi:hypothetical protein